MRTRGIGALLAALLGLAPGPADGRTPAPGAGTPVGPRSAASARDTLRPVGLPFTPGAAPSAVAAGDLTGDGRVDLLVANTDDGTVVLLAGDGAGGWSAARAIPAGENPVDVALGDLDGDGDLDAVVANHETDYVTLLANDGGGRLAPFPRSPLRLDLAPHPHAVELADLDGDGRLDLLVDDRHAEAILLLRGAGDGTFDRDAVRIDVGGDPYRGMYLADLDGDGLTDIITPNPRTVAVTLRSADGGFAPPREIPSAGPFEVGAGDLDGDGRLDLVVADEPGPVRVLAGNGDGTFRPTALFEHRWTSGAKAVAVGDFDGDGLDDAAVTCWSSRQALVLFGGRNGVRMQLVGGGENPWGVGTADLTGDGRDELLVLDNTGDALRVYGFDAESRD
ncbi:MAG: VCBS repeat-containing protein [Gemmatimonadota bacterium]